MSQQWTTIEAAANRLGISVPLARKRARAGEFGETIPDPANANSILVKADVMEAMKPRRYRLHRGLGIPPEPES